MGWCASSCWRFREDPNAPACLAVIDRETIWYGTLPLLAFSRKDDCSLRFKSAEVAHEVVEAIGSVGLVGKG